MNAVAVALSMEVLMFRPQSSRGDEMLMAMWSAAAKSGVRVVKSLQYRGGSNLLMLWGPGHPARMSAMRQQQKAGGHSIVWDLAYWHRDRKVRVSIDAAHPSAWVMRRTLPETRLREDRIVTADAWDPTGPVVVAGIGAKARIQYGAGAVDAWEASMMHEAKTRGLMVQYRRKEHVAPMPIDQQLRGASLAITWHSNVAVDAIRMGIPVICRDGAAAAVCPSTFPATGSYTPLDVQTRARFLSNLAWFQWAPTEAHQCWRFLSECLA